MDRLEARGRAREQAHLRTRRGRWERAVSEAVAVATQAERAELERALDMPDPSRAEELVERLMRRAGETRQADALLVGRDGLWKTLTEKETGMKEAGYVQDTHPALRRVSHAREYRGVAVRQGVPQMDDPGQIEAVIGLIVDPATAWIRIKRLVGAG